MSDDHITSIEKQKKEKEREKISSFWDILIAAEKNNRDAVACHKNCYYMQGNFQEMENILPYGAVGYRYDLNSGKWYQGVVDQKRKYVESEVANQQTLDLLQQYIPNTKSLYENILIKFSKAQTHSLRKNLPKELKNFKKLRGNQRSSFGYNYLDNGEKHHINSLYDADGIRCYIAKSLEDGKDEEKIKIKLMFLGTRDVESALLDLDSGSPGYKAMKKNKNQIIEHLIERINELSTRYPNKKFDIDLKGFSLGGALAQELMVALMDKKINTSDLEKIDEISLQTINSPKISEKTCKLASELLKDDKCPKVSYTNVINTLNKVNDPVTTYGSERLFYESDKLENIYAEVSVPHRSPNFVKKLYNKFFNSHLHSNQFVENIQIDGEKEKLKTRRKETKLFLKFLNVLVVEPIKLAKRMTNKDKVAKHSRINESKDKLKKEGSASNFDPLIFGDTPDNTSLVESLKEFGDSPKPFF